MAQYAAITRILPMPDVAKAGETIEVMVEIENVGSIAREMWPGRTRYNDIIFRVYDASGKMHVLIQPGKRHSWFGSFTMPDKDALIYVESWAKGDDGIWRMDDTDTKTVYLEGPIGPPVFSDLICSYSKA